MAIYKKETEYILESEEEAKRLANQHKVVKDAMGGQLLRAPIDLSGGGLKILDSGTADGTWIRDLVSTLKNASSHEFVGTDINPKDFPSSTPQGTTYHVQDILSPYPKTWIGAFDFVHQRLVLPGALSQQQFTVQKLAELVKPGGWIQLIEAENIVDEDDGPYMKDFIGFKKSCFTGMKANLKLTREIPGWLEQAGFQNVESELFWMKLGRANDDAELGKTGIYSTAALVEALVPFAKRLPDGAVVFGESGSTLETFADHLRKELGERGGHLPLRVLWAQKAS